MAVSAHDMNVNSSYQNKNFHRIYLSKLKTVCGRNANNNIFFFLLFEKMYFIILFTVTHFGSGNTDRHITHPAIQTHYTSLSR